jgi:hypothetical protein
MRSPRLALTLAAAPLALASCGGLACNEMYAPSGLSIGFEAADWPAGAYAVEVEGVACTVTLPSEDGGATCDADSAPYLELMLTSGGDAIQSAWYYEDAPDPVSIRVSRDGTVIFEDDISPDYTVDEPNGKGCGERTSAAITVALD